MFPVSYLAEWIFAWVLPPEQERLARCCFVGWRFASKKSEAEKQRGISNCGVGSLILHGGRA